MGTLEQAASICRRALGFKGSDQAQAHPGPPAAGAIACDAEHPVRVIMRGAAPFRAGPSARLMHFSAHALGLRFDGRMDQLSVGQRLSLRLEGPMASGRARVMARVRVTGIHDIGPMTDIEVSLLRPSAPLLAHLAHYALAHGRSDGAALTPAELRRRHFGPMDASPCLRFGSLESASEMAAIKSLRFDVFKQSALLKPSQIHPDDTEDERDQDSHILTAYWRERLVATCRVYAMQLGDSYEFDAWAKGTSCLPPKDDCVELGRAAIDPSFRNAGVPLQLFRMITAYTMASGRRYMVLGTQPSLVPFYRCFGFQLTPIRFPFPGRTDFLAHVLVADLHALWRGKEGNPLVWYALFGSLPKDCAQGYYAPRSAQETVRIEVLRRLGLVSRSVNHCLAWQSRWRHLMRN